MPDAAVTPIAGLADAINAQAAEYDRLRLIIQQAKLLQEQVKAELKMLLQLHGGVERELTTPLWDVKVFTQHRRKLDLKSLRAAVDTSPYESIDEVEVLRVVAMGPETEEEERDDR